MAIKHHFLHLGIKIFIWTLLVEPNQSADTGYESCKPRQCSSGPKLSYPFYIPNDVKADIHNSCGYPGFEVGCENDRPVFRSSGGFRYLIQDIFYENQTFRLVSADVIDSSCAAPLHNFSFDHSPLEFSPNHADLFFFYNCTSLPSTTQLQLDMPEACASIATNQSFVVLSTDEKNGLDEASTTCKSSVKAPVDFNFESEKFSEVKDVDLSRMMKKGFTLKWIGVGHDCTECQGSGGQCGFDEGDSVCFCPDRPHVKHCGQGKDKWRLLLILGLCFGASGIALCLMFYIIRRRYQHKSSSSDNILRKCSQRSPLVFWKTKTESFKNIEVFLEAFGSLCPKRFSYSDIKKITNSFKEKLGQGGFGGVYRGKLQDGRPVAVKVLKGSKGNGEDFINEVSSISRTSHVNVVTLLGFCFEGHRRALVYEFMPNGSLEKFIYEKGPLTSDRQLEWETLYKIAIGIARGLEYLHRGCNTRILHFDIKPHNILLDEDFCPKICDFGLAKICPRKESIVSMFGARGTPGYIAPEVFSRNFGGVSHKSDVYSYGMMVLEMVGGRRNIDCEADRTSELYFPHWIYKRIELHQELGLHGIADNDEKEEARKMIIVSMWCIQADPSNRPPMNRVVEMLEGRIDSLQIPPQPFLSSPSRSPPSDSPVIMG